MSDHPITGMAFLIMSLRKQIATLTAERDEARREICEKVAAHAPSVNAKQWAQERGWDCYKKEVK
jgi:hypothetical protein